MFRRPRQVKLASKRFLAGSLGFAAGVMLYVSLVEIFVKSQGAFVAHGSSEADAYTYATVSLFGGILFYKGIDYVVHLLEGDVGNHNVDIHLYDLDGSSSGNNNPSRSAAAKGTDFVKGETVADLAFSAGDKPLAQTGTNGGGNGQQQAHHRPQSSNEFPRDHDGAAKAAMKAGEAVEAGYDQKLVRMGLMAAVAIGIHNFPEGLATFVGALSDPSVGLALAVAIAIHNIPEGLCVAIPVYYATGNRWKAFGWALLSGVSEPIGAALGWLILKDVMSELVYGLLFGAVAGMMVKLTIHELIPTAVRYDPADKVTTNSIIAGMAIMALSLILFKY
ncbi:unnamed protein product [Laminaria digitata]